MAPPGQGDSRIGERVELSPAGRASHALQVLRGAYRRMDADKHHDSITRDDGPGCVSGLVSLGQHAGRAHEKSHGRSTDVLCSKQAASQRRHWG